MKIFLILGLVFSSWSAWSWSCDLTVYTDQSSVDSCFGRILDHWIHDAKADAVKAWQAQRTYRSDPTLARAGNAWSLESVKNILSELAKLNDAKDHLARDRRYADVRDISLTCPVRESSSE